MCFFFFSSERAYLQILHDALFKWVYLTMYVENLISQNTELCSLIIVSVLHVVLQYHLTRIKHGLGSGDGCSLKTKVKYPVLSVSVLQIFSTLQWIFIHLHILLGLLSNHQHWLVNQRRCKSCVKTEQASVKEFWFWFFFSNGWISTIVFKIKVRNTENLFFN